jgi:hypothetical protein
METITTIYNHYYVELWYLLMLINLKILRIILHDDFIPPRWQFKLIDLIDLITVYFEIKFCIFLVERYDSILNYLVFAIILHLSKHCEPDLLCDALIIYSEDIKDRWRTTVHIVVFLSKYYTTLHYLTF